MKAHIADMVIDGGRKMYVLLLDADKYAALTGVEVERQMVSYPMQKIAKRTWSNGWCPTSCMKVTAEGLVARISNELVPKDIYSGYTVERRELDTFWWSHKVQEAKAKLKEMKK